MKVSKWGNSLAIRLPANIAAQLGFAEGDQLKMEGHDGKLIAEKQISLKEAMKRLRKHRGTIPADFAFDREEANRRGK